MAHEIIDAGACCIIGHHPHVIQGLEVYAGRPIFYSLGSFIYNPFAERVFVEKKIKERLLTIAVKINFDKKDIREWDIIPFENEKTSLVPLTLEKAEKESFVKKFELLSNRICQGGNWYYSEAADNLIKREIHTIWQLTKESGGFFLLKKIRDLKMRHFKILFSSIGSKLLKKLH